MKEFSRIQPMIMCVIDMNTERSDRETVTELLRVIKLKDHLIRELQVNLDNAVRCCNDPANCNNEADANCPTKLRWLLESRCCEHTNIHPDCKKFGCRQNEYNAEMKGYKESAPQVDTICGAPSPSFSMGAAASTGTLVCSLPEGHHGAHSWQAATPDHARDWIEDFPHENGNYRNFCSRCGNLFTGHKRRTVCHICATPATADKCPTCDSPAAHLHPAVQHEGECQICNDPWHTATADTDSSAGEQEGGTEQSALQAQAQQMPPGTATPPSAGPTPRTDAHLAHLNLADGRKVGIPDETVNLLLQLERELVAANAKLPEGMKHCTILFKQCAKGHGWLTATNWVQHDCAQCALEAERKAHEEYKTKYLLLSEQHKRLCEQVYEEDGETLKQDTLHGRVKELERENAQLRDCIQGAAAATLAKKDQP